MTEFFRRRYNDMAELESVTGLSRIASLPHQRNRWGKQNRDWFLGIQYLFKLLTHHARPRLAEGPYLITVLSLTRNVSAKDLVQQFDRTDENAQYPLRLIDTEQNFFDPNAEKPEPAKSEDADDGTDVATDPAEANPIASAESGTFLFAPLRSNAPGPVAAYWHELANMILLVLDADDLDRRKIDNCLADIGAHRGKVVVLTHQGR